MNKILKNVKRGVMVIPQYEYVAASLKDYLHRHPEMNTLCSKGGKAKYYTTENPNSFKENAKIFLHECINVDHVELK